MTPTPAARFARRPAPVVMQIGMGVWIYGAVLPIVRTLERVGAAERLLGAFGARRAADLAKKNPFRGYVPGPQDVFVMTYAKSGTNWMMQIAHQLIYHGQGAFQHVHDVIPWPDTQAMPGPMRRYAIPLAQADDWKTSPERKRVIKTHFDWDMLPYSEDARYIAVIRDPKDVFVSNYLFIRDSVFGAAMPSVDTWFNLYLTDRFMLGGSWAVNAAGYWAQRHRPNVLIASFKAMKRDLRGTVVTVAKFLGIDTSDALVDEVCRLSSFQYMKGIDEKFRVGKMIPWRPEGAMIRRGQQGGSAELLSPARQRQIDEHFTAELKRLGSDFPYEQFCDPAR